jgi:transcriptional regulator with XRE-family HTH domain
MRETMTEPILTSERVKEVRALLGLSQGFVAATTGIKRTYLSLFKNDRYVLDVAALNTLRYFYEDQGYSFSNTSPAPQSRYS